MKYAACSDFVASLTGLRAFFCVSKRVLRYVWRKGPCPPHETRSGTGRNERRAFQRRKNMGVGQIRPAVKCPGSARKRPARKNAPFPASGTLCFQVWPCNFQKAPCPRRAHSPGHPLPERTATPLSLAQARSPDTVSVKTLSAGTFPRTGTDSRHHPVRTAHLFRFPPLRHGLRSAARSPAESFPSSDPAEVPDSQANVRASKNSLPPARGSSRA